MLIGSQNPITLDHDQIRDRFGQPSVHEALTEVGIQSPEALLATYVTDRAGLKAYVQDAPPVTDDFWMQTPTTLITPGFLTSSYQLVNQ